MRKLTVTALVVLGLCATQVAHADDGIPPVNTTDCPATLPTVRDPGWRCEVLTTDATAHVGALGELRLGRQRLTFAEGNVNGQYASVFGGLAAEPTPVPGGLFGHTDVPVLRLAFQVQYAGASDFHGNPPHMGFVNMKFRVISPLLPPTCFIGTNQDPIVIRPMAEGAPGPVDGHPELRYTRMRDDRFVMPHAHGCGPLTSVVERRFGVPSTPGSSEITLPTYIFIKQYDASHTRNDKSAAVGEPTIGR
jgi:hypothetical protein